MKLFRRYFMILALFLICFFGLSRVGAYVADPDATNQEGYVNYEPVLDTPDMNEPQQSQEVYPYSGSKDESQVFNKKHKPKSEKKKDAEKTPALAGITSPPRKRSHLPFIIGIALVLGIVGYAWFQHSSKSQVPDF